MPSTSCLQPFPASGSLAAAELNNVLLRIFLEEPGPCPKTVLLFFDYSSLVSLGFSDSSVGKESTCNSGDPGSIPGSGGSPGEGLGYPLQYSWASLVAQLLKNLPAVWETCVQSLDWEDPLEKGMATHSSILAWRIPWTV